MSMADTRSPQPVASGGSGSNGGYHAVRTSGEYEDDTLAGHVSRSAHTGNGIPTHHATSRNSRGFGAAGHEILGSDRSTHTDRGSMSSKEVLPPRSTVTPTGGLYIDPTDEYVAPQLVSVQQHTRSHEGTGHDRQ